MHLSIYKTIKSERLKLKRSPVWLAFFILPIISAFFGTFNFWANQGLLKNEWYSLWSQHTLFLCYIFMPALIGTYCSYLVAAGTSEKQLEQFLDSTGFPHFLICR